MKMTHTFVRILAYLSIEERKYHVAVCCISFLRRVVQYIDRHGIKRELWRCAGATISLKCFNSMHFGGSVVRNSPKSVIECFKSL